MVLLNTIPGFIEIESIYDGEILGKEWVNINMIKCFGAINGGTHVTLINDSENEDYIYRTPHPVKVVVDSIRQAQMRTSNPSFI